LALLTSSVWHFLQAQFSKKNKCNFGLLRRCDMEPMEKYEAGLCNIGPQEISVRKKLFNCSLLVTLMLACLSLSFFQHNWMMFLLFFSFFCTVLLLIEIRLKFCILFGLFNLYNFNRPGDLQNVNGSNDQQKDRIKCYKIVTVATLGAATLTFLDYLLVVYLYL
jgi:hypothetical protein